MLYLEKSFCYIKKLFYFKFKATLAALLLDSEKIFHYRLHIF